MDSENGVLTWFKELDGAERIDFMCDLFSCCLPLELQFFLTNLKGMCCMEDLKLRLVEIRANDLNSSKTWTNLEDSGTRSSLLVIVPFLYYNSYDCAEAIYRFLLEKFPGEKFNWEEIAIHKTALREVILLLTLAVNHPAFRFDHKSYFTELLEYIKKNELLRKQNQNGILQSESSSSPPSSPTPSNEDKSIFPKEEPCSSSSCPSKENISSVSQEEPCSSSSCSSKENINSVSQEEPCFSSSCSSKENVNSVSQEKPCSSSSSKETVKVSQVGTCASSPSKENLNSMAPEELSTSPSKENGTVSEHELSSCSLKENRTVSEEELSLSSPSKENGTVLAEELSSSSSSKENGTVLEEELSSSSLSKENVTVVEELSSSSPETKESLTLKTSVDSSVSSSVILKRPPMAGRSGRIRSIELKGAGKKGAYRIAVTWSSGNKTELFKTFKQLKNFQQKVVQLSSDSSVVNGVKKDISALPDLSTIASFSEDLVEHYDKIATYLSDFVALLPLSVRDHDSVIAFFQPSNSQPPRPILVGQGLNQASFTEKQSISPNFYPAFRYGNNGRQYTFHNRQFRNSTSLWNSSNNWNYQRTYNTFNHPRNHGSFYHPKSLRQERWKLYPPVSGNSTSCSPHNSRSGSSENSRSSSPGPENTIGTNNSRGKKNLRNRWAENESESSEAKPGRDKHDQCWDNYKKDTEKIKFHDKK